MIQRASGAYPVKIVVCIPVFDGCNDADLVVSVKSNRQQLWCKSNTCSPPHGKPNGTDNTYIIGLGGNKQEHDQVDELFPTELASLRSKK
jgi:hypothetical protein